MKKLSLLVMTFIGATSLAACSKKTTTTPADNGGDFDKSDLINPKSITEGVSTKMLTTSTYLNINYLSTTLSDASAVFADMVDGLIEIDKYDRYVPALASSWTAPTLNQDGDQVWTFTLRDDIFWQHPQTGARVARVTADDWVAAAQYVLLPTTNSPLSTLYSKFVRGASEYQCAQTQKRTNEKLDCASEWSERKLKEYEKMDSVGVKALDDKTVQFTTVGKVDYFLSVLTYNAFYPVNRKYLEENYTTFGQDTSKILVNGAYLIPTETKEELVKHKNPIYWDAENVRINTIKLSKVSNDATPDIIYERYKQGEIDKITISQGSKAWDELVVGPEGTGTYETPYSSEAYSARRVDKYTYYSTFVFNRDYKDSISNRSEIMKTRAREALLNVNFRRGFLYGLYRDALQQILKANVTDGFANRRNTLVPANFAFDSNGKDYQEYFFEVACEQINKVTSCSSAQLAEVKKQLSDNGSGLGDIVKATQFFEQARNDLRLTPNDVIEIEMLTEAEVGIKVFYNALIENFNKNFSSLNIKLLGLEPRNTEQWDKMLEARDYDFSFTGSNWGADYSDATSYLNIWSIGGEAMDASNIHRTPGLQNEVLGVYNDVYEASFAADLTEVERFRQLALAEYTLIYDQAIILPQRVSNDVKVEISRFLPFQKTSVQFGTTYNKLKFLALSENKTVVTAEERAKLEVDYLAAREAARANYAWNAN